MALDTTTDAFVHGQLYVGATRAPNSEAIHIVIDPIDVHGGRAVVKNVVDPQFLGKPRKKEISAEEKEYHEMRRQEQKERREKKKKKKKPKTRKRLGVLTK